MLRPMEFHRQPNRRQQIPFDARGAAAVTGLARSGADVLLVHWLVPTSDYPLTGAVAVGILLNALGPEMVTAAHWDCPQYRLDRLRRN